MRNAPKHHSLWGETEGIPKVQNGFCLEDSYYYSALADRRLRVLPPRADGGRQYTELLLILAEGRNLMRRGPAGNHRRKCGNGFAGAGMPA